MIRKVFAQNFRSIRALTLELNGFECLVGPNNSGKSNLFDVFSFMADAIRLGVPRALSVRQPQRARHYAAPESEPTIVEVSIDLPASLGYTRAEYTMGFRGDPAFIDREILNAYAEPGKATTLFSYQRDAKGMGSLMRRGAGEGQVGVISDLASRTHGVIGDAAPIWEYLREYISRFRRYRFVPDLLKHEGQATRADELASDGRNFASYLLTIHSGHRGHFGRIEEQLRKSFPNVEELVTPMSPTHDGFTEVGIKEKWFRKIASGVQLSDGLAGFIAYLAVLYGPEEPTLAIFEEPENHIHPRLMEKLVEMLRGASRDQQVLISTHSVPLINRLSLKDLVIVERGTDGGTTARRVHEKAELEAALKDWALGEAYASGVLDAA